MNSPRNGFTRIELLALLAALFLCAMVAAPLLAGTSASSTRGICLNNLRQIGAGVRLWSSDHADQTPWMTYTTNGGSKPIALQMKTAIAWTEFLALSNELATPKILACPQDSATQVAANFTTGPGGFANSGLRGQALSYFVNFHSDFYLPRSVVTGDRDFGPDGRVTGVCPEGGSGAYAILSTLGQPPPVRWTNLVHATTGNLLFIDGSAEPLPSLQLRGALVTDNGNDNTTMHYAPPR